MKDNLKLAGWIFLFLIMIYIICSINYYRFSNPDLTQTELVLDFWKAITWDW